MRGSEKITGIILAGGQSSRMQQEKGLVPLLGKPLIEYVIDNLTPYCNRIIISSNGNAYDQYGLPVFPDVFPGTGPMGGIYSCLRESLTETNLVLACDMPFFGSKAIECLLENNTGKPVVVPWHGENMFEPMSAIYHKRFSEVLKSCLESGVFKLPFVFKQEEIIKLPVKQYPDCFPDVVFLNINSMRELKGMEELMRKGIIEL